MSTSGLLNGTLNNENFAQFFESWIALMDRDLQTLAAAAAAPRPITADDEAAEERRLRQLVADVVGHYEHYYRRKAAAARRDVLPMFSPTWTSTTENLFIWIAGWRPTVAVQILYSKCGIQYETQIPPDVVDVDAEQLRRIDELHRRIVQREREVSEEEAAAQEKVANSEMVEISHAMGEMAAGEGKEMMEAEMKGKRDEMEEVMEMADAVRMETLKGLVEILRPKQAVQFLVAAAELLLRVHEFGRSKDEATMKAAGEAAPAPAPATL
ncbi:TGACG-sequence-specific DNA-binding protein TGA-2.1 [Apostasia shenzhenica]|uniref:TGACG-sequence-specific DNA-binding protein TGA-2.1 n=1 Tax=Apostasia shenzhenica TaxID=1088818 RepID=A0A2I0BGI4_9ASPA|nr:TGACG-sequence-specific DNA-binding protein TGA-2.1 [Apostasia shenzhenica]